MSLAGSESTPETPSRLSRVDSSTAAASSAGGLALILNFCIPFFIELTPDQKTSLMSITPVLGVGLTWIITRLFRSYAKEPQLVQNERRLKKAMKRAKKDLEDPHIPDDHKEKIKEEYARYAALYREPSLLGQE